MLQFSCSFAFLSPFRLSNWTPKTTQIWKITHHIHYCASNETTA